MITLEISPDVLTANAPLPLDIKTDSEQQQQETTTVKTGDSGEILGIARQTQNPGHVVRFFQGKGGFCSVVYNSDIIYFGLPGSRIVLPGTDVELPGERIQSRDFQPESPQPVITPQTVTTQAMILGAGLATRFEPISGDTTGYSKPAVPLIGEDSVIVAIAKHLRTHGFKRILINTFYKPEEIKRQLREVDGIEVVFIDEDAPSGTAGGLAKALEQGLVDRSQPMFIIQGDAVTDADLSFLMNTHRDRNAAVSIGGQIVSDEDVNKFGIIETDASGGDGQSGHITSFKEKPSLAEAGPSRFANSGFYILSPEVFDLFLAGWNERQRQQAIYDYAQHFFPAVLNAVNAQKIANTGSGQSMAFWAQAVGGYWSDIGNPAQYIQSVRDVYEGKLNVPMPEPVSEFYENGIIFWPGTKAIAGREEARLTGNVIVARRV